MPERLKQALIFIRKHGGGFALQVLVNAVLPLIIFDLGQKRLGDVRALLASSIPPIAWSIVEFARHRKVDAISMLVLTGIALSLAAFLGTGGAKFLQLRETLVGGLVGLIFLTSVVVRRPLFFYLARASTMRSDPSQAKELEALRGNVYFERTMRNLTLGWGLGLITHTTVNCVLVFAVSIPTYLAISPVIGYAFMGAMILCTALYVRRARALGEARRAVALAQAESEEMTGSAGAEGAVS
jgi:hypothetical protein